jgi:hypothetical protein
MDRHGFLRRFGFTRADESANDGPRHVHCSRRETDVTPFQSKQLACPIPVDAVMKNKLLPRIFKPSRRILSSLGDSTTNVEFRFAL